MIKIEFKCKKNDKLSNVLLNYGFSYNAVCKLLRSKDIRINGVKTSNDDFVFNGNDITVFASAHPLNKFEIVFEDENVYVINKFSGIEVEGEDGLEGRLEGSRAVHRLDRNTQGLLIMARNKNSERILLKAIKERCFEKKYLAEVVGKCDFSGERLVAFGLKDNKTSYLKVTKNFVQNSQRIETIFKTLKSTNQTSVVEATLITGKTHQIRAHLAYLGNPIVGDGKYGKNEDNKKFKEKSQKLHCYYLKLNGLCGELEYLNGRVFNNLPDWAKGLKI